MRLRDELADPWGLLLAGVGGGLAWAAGSGVPPEVAIGIGAAIYGVKVVIGLVSRRNVGQPRESGVRVLPVQRGSLEESWLRRAAVAEQAFTDVARSVLPGPIAERVRSFGEQTDDALQSIRRLAGQASAVGTALVRVDVRRLRAEHDRLVAAMAAHGDRQVRREQERSLTSVVAQIETHDRLQAARSALLARIESGTLALEGLVARLAEVVALAETTIAARDGAAEIDSLAVELDGLRNGLVEAEDVSNRTLTGMAGLPPPAAGTVRKPRAGRDRLQTYPPTPDDEER